jgi:hypothetical protein
MEKCWGAKTWEMEERPRVDLFSPDELLPSNHCTGKPHSGVKLSVMLETKRV